MQFNHDNMTGPALAADLVTLVGRGWDDERATSVLTHHHIRRIDLDADASHRLAAWSARLRPVFATHDVDARCAAINALLTEGTAQPYLTAHDGLRPHLHFAAEDDDVVARVAAVTAGGLALFAVEAGGKRLGMCARSGCTVAFVDTSRNGLRSYCSTTCGNYMAVRRHRDAETITRTHSRRRSLPGTL